MNIDWYSAWITGAFMHFTFFIGVNHEKKLNAKDIIIIIAMSLCWPAFTAWVIIGQIRHKVS